MKIKLFIFLGILLTVFNWNCKSNNEPLTEGQIKEIESSLKVGDVIFHISKSGQGKAIQLATNSKYNHVGVIVENNGQNQVLEAIHPVRFTPIAEWIQRGERKHYVVKRLNTQQALSDEQVSCLNESGLEYVGKPYDFYFGWDNSRIYCSELVWKLYKNCLGLEIGKLQNFGEFDLKNPIVQHALKQRFGDQIPYSEKVISPGEMFDSPLLMTVNNL
ncbi:MAG: YiiX family permuted papain-like enzyme [Saprospiraceae bacterium]|nr:YiiX family permuted papain-like enzyme [Saprospiraceae bacterium]